MESNYKSNHARRAKFSMDENQRKNLFDLCVAIVVLIVVFLTFSLNAQWRTQRITHRA
jgi:lipopolysaccharide/colanic/teichoic acid biosynthesis glycosyltransferase